jgi:uncharacterized protein YjbI with pentapeptide repeats/beta-lactamase regulating signal transducer with metallopeptidase domain
MIVIAATVLNALWQDALLVLCAWLLLRIWPRINAATRYAVWSTTLLAAFVVPVATTLAFFAPAQTAAAPAVRSAVRAESFARSTFHPARPHVRETRAAASSRDLRDAAFSPPPRLRVTLPLQVALAVFAAWALLTGYALIGLCVGLWRLEQLKRDALPLPVDYRDAMPQWNAANKGLRPVRLCVSDAIDVPVAVGLFDAMILIPRALLDRLTPAEVEQISLHELAHLRRGDDWSNCLQRLIVGALGWNPAALFVAQQLDLEREVACDDWVLSSLGTVRPYALCLTKMAETAAWPHHPMPAPGVFTTRKQISLRIERLLGTGRDIATTLAIAPAAAAVGAVAALGLVITLVAPTVAAPAVATAPVTAIEPPAARPAARPQRLALAPPSTQAPSTAPMATQPPAPRLAHSRPKPPAPPAPGTASDLESLAGKIVAREKIVAKELSPTVSRQTIAQTGGKSCVGCDLSGVNWAGRDLSGANYTGVDFSRANLAGVNLSQSMLNGADFTKANLSGASFRRAHLTGCDFTQANLQGADFSGAWLSGCEFVGARLQSAQLRDVLAGCKGCDFSRADLSGLDLSGVRINGDDFSHADLRNVNFAGAQLVGSDFSNARLDGANLAGATLNGCDLEGVDLRHVDLSKTKMIGMDFSQQRTPP